MKQIGKKLGGLVSLGILTLSMTGCMGSQEEINETVMNNLYSTTTSTMETLVAYDNATMEQAIEEAILWKLIIRKTWKRQALL